MNINSQKKCLFHGSKAVKVNVLRTFSKTPVTGPPESQTSLVPCYHFRLCRARLTERECFSLLPLPFLHAKHLLWLPMNQVLLPLLPWKLSSQENVTNKAEASLSQAGLVNRKQEHHSSQGS